MGWGCQIWMMVGETGWGVEVTSEKYAIRFFVSFSWGNYSSKN